MKDYTSQLRSILPSWIKVESRGNPRAVSSAGAKGLLQLMPDTAMRYGVTDPFDKEQNVNAALKYGNFLMNRYGGDLPTALMAYHAGEGNVDNFLAGKKSGVGPLTKAYPKKILGGITLARNDNQLSDAGFAPMQQRPQPTQAEPQPLPQEAAKMVNLSDYYKEPQAQGLIPVKRDKKAHWQDGLLALGLGMLANNNGSFAGALGQGGIAGLNTMGGMQQQDQEEALADAKIAAMQFEAQQKARETAMQQAQQEALQNVDLANMSQKDLANQLLKLGMTNEALAAYKAANGADPYWTNIPTANGMYAVNARNPKELMQLTDTSGRPIIKSSDDPMLQGNISSAKEYGKNAPIIDRTRVTENIKTDASINEAERKVPISLGEAREKSEIDNQYALEKKKQETQLQAQIDLPKLQAETEYATSLIDKVLSHKGLSDVVGVPNPFTKWTPGTNAADFNAIMEQLGGKQFLQAFESLKGGGQITEIEGNKATNAIAALSTSQSEEAFKENLSILKSVIKAGADRMAQKAGGGSQQAQQYNKQNVDDLVKKLLGK